VAEVEAVAWQERVWDHRFAASGACSPSAGADAGVGEGVDEFQPDRLVVPPVRLVRYRTTPLGARLARLEYFTRRLCDPAMDTQWRHADRTCQPSGAVLGEGWPNRPGGTVNTRRMRGAGTPGDRILGWQGKGTFRCRRWSRYRIWPTQTRTRQAFYRLVL
jgi:hypothetical protein